MAYWLDDGFDTWPEVIRAGTSAAGLYSRCGSWIARNLNDGHVPGEVAAMYGSPEWSRKLVDVGLWEIEGSGYRDVRYFQMGNPTAEKVRARRQADADRKARWREKKHRSRRDDTRDSAGSHNGTDAVTPLSPALPPSKEGQGRAPARARGAPHALEDQDPGPTFLDDPIQLAEYHEEIARTAEEATLALAEQRRTARNGAALARQVLAARAKSPPTTAIPPEGAA